MFIIIYGACVKYCGQQYTAQQLVQRKVGKPFQLTYAWLGISVQKNCDHITLNPIPTHMEMAYPCTKINFLKNDK